MLDTPLSVSTTHKPGDSYMQSFARGLEVIRSFNASAPQQTLSEVAARTGLTRAGARRILLTLQTLGYLESDGRLFRLTPRILDLGFAYLSSTPSGIWRTDGSADRARARVLLGRRARRAGHRLCAAHTHAQDHEHQPGRGLAPAGLLDVDGPGAAGGPARGRPARRLAALPRQAFTRHTALDDQVLLARIARRASRLVPGRPGAGGRPDLRRRAAQNRAGQVVAALNISGPGKPHQHRDAARAAAARPSCWPRRRRPSRAPWACAAHSGPAC